MSFISPSLIARIYQALGQDRGSDAILLLRQHSFAEQPTPDNELMSAVAQLADECYYGGDVERAEDHYKLGIALYEGCFHCCHAEALKCSAGLVAIYCLKNTKSQEMLDAIEQSAKICGRLEKIARRPQALAG